MSTYRFDSHSMEHVDNILGSDISSGAFSKWTTTETSDGRVDDGNAHLESSQNVHQSLPICIMAVDGDDISGQVFQCLLEKFSHFNRRANSNGVTEGNLIAAHLV